MKTGKEYMANLFGIETYEEKFNQKCIENEILAKRIAKLTISLENTEAELKFYKLNDENKLKIMREDIKGLEDQYTRNIQIYEELTVRCNAMIDDMESKLQRMYSKGLSEGRMAAYSEMGIWRLDAIKDGNRLVMDACGDVYELLELQDVKAEDTNMVTDDGIIIDDLTDIGA